MTRYEKPRLEKRAMLSVVTAQSVPSNFTPSPQDGNEDGNDEGGGIT
ncbi:MAG: hypothetical protein NTV73_03110 [Hyphomicrobiales bacterium]|nr:hypothetical protein [Hyphomicrobiales bacterium]